MTPLLTFAQKTSYDLTPSSKRLPSFLWSAFTTINHIHGVWRWYRRAELYTNPQNFSQLLAGHALHFVVGDVLLLRIAAQCLLIATRILECAQQQKKLFRAGVKWKEAFQGHYSKPHQISWKKQHTNFWLSPSSVDWLKRTQESLWNRLQRIAKCTVAIFIQIFKLSMRMMDTIDAFSFSPYTRNEGINEGFVNMVKWLDTLVENKEELLDGMIKNREIVEKILLGSPFTYDQLHKNVIKTLDQTEDFYHKVKKISEFGNGVLVKCGKRMANGYMVIAGLSDLRPSTLI